MKACHFLMLTDWFEEMIRNWLQLVCTSFRIKWVKVSLGLVRVTVTLGLAKSQIGEGNLFSDACIMVSAKLHVATLDHVEFCTSLFS